MKKTLFWTILLISSYFSTTAFAEVRGNLPEPVSSNAEISVEIEYEKIDRVKSLEVFFEKYNSPLKENAEKFVEVSDQYQIDYRLLPSISCMESTCGKFLIEGSYNPFGWGIYGDNAIYFEDYNEAIETVGEGLAKNYFQKGRDTVEEIAPVYTPPNHVNWKNGANYFIDKIEDSQIKTE